ncbi:(2Fe-2S)-binding protein [Actinokineospora diospyrosa]|uniref:FhuF 2Fe-2S C-terminal domain-containing protein n=1 Tax=Actinokineospora diospyrosa TaxID=103728 RepID=A0ABT1IDV4_9PSEU|nr:(2Fe-2S)-binding protein [Actinokineospora diospyrosa]MCP2270768.1 FhuF 2Fe-2S C-terminal domain-containing protein [Actinokineospora diospyrosa]
MTAGYRTAVAARGQHAHLAESLARVNPRQSRAQLRFGLPEGPDRWVGCDEFLRTPGAFDQWRDGLAGWLRDKYSDSPDRTTAGYVMTWYLWVPGYLAGLLFHHERRIPSLRPADLAFRMAEPRPHPDAIAVLSPRFVCLPDDPAAGVPEATVVPDEHALAALLRGRFAAHAARFVEVYGPQVRLGKRMLWAAATDVLDSSLWLAGRYGGTETEGVLDAALVLGDGPAPFTSGSTLRPQPTGEWARRRESCCFHYLLAEGQGTCASCPRLGRKTEPAR